YFLYKNFRPFWIEPCGLERMTDYLPVRLSNVGATQLPDGSWQFVAWAPGHKSVQLHLPCDDTSLVEMEKDDLGYHQATVMSAKSGMKYTYRLNGSDERPDPASRFQPDGVHGPSMLVDVSSFDWTDFDWQGHDLEDSVFYELHVGTFTPEGTFAADELLPICVPKRCRSTNWRMA